MHRTIDATGAGCSSTSPARAGRCTAPPPRSSSRGLRAARDGRRPTSSACRELLEALAGRIRPAAVHTSRELSAALCSLITVDGRPAELDGAPPASASATASAPRARLLGGSGREPLVLAARRDGLPRTSRRCPSGRACSSSTWNYPLLRLPLSLCRGHRNLDIWPSHKEVVVEPEPEALLRTINDRAITRLVVEDADAPASPSSRARRWRARAGPSRRRSARASRSPATRSPSVTRPRCSPSPTARPPNPSHERRGLLEDGRPVET